MEVILNWKFSNMWAGVHFQDAIDSIKPISKQIGKMAADMVLKHAKGEV